MHSFPSSGKGCPIAATSPAFRGGGWNASVSGVLAEPPQTTALGTQNGEKSRMRRRPSKPVPEKVLLGDPSSQILLANQQVLSPREIATSPSPKKKLTHPPENGRQTVSYFPTDSTLPDEDAKVKSILFHGGQKEEDARREADLKKRDQALSEALQIYNKGCNASELYSKIQDSHGTDLWLFDRSDWANVFFSAARICTQFANKAPLDRNGESILPRQFKSDGPALTASDWNHQALHYLEQGRSRSLLQSISHGSAVTEKERRILYKTVKNSMRMVVDAAVRSIKQRETLASMPSQPPPIPPTTGDPLPEVITELEHMRESPASVLPPQGSGSSNRSIGPSETVSKSHRRAKSRTQDDTRLSIQTSDSIISNKGSVTNSPASVMSAYQIDEELLAKWKIQMRWRKAMLFARTGNPNLGDVLLGDIEKIRASIPKDTIVVEYALASTPPCGIMTIVAASDGIRVAQWQETDATRIQESIAELRISMEFAQSRPKLTRAGHMSSASRSRSIVRPSGPQRKASAICQEKLSHLLYDSVVAPVKPHLEGMKKLIIIPSGDLANVPWAIFFDGPITVVPSLNIWSRLQTQADSAEKRFPKISVVSNAPKDKEKERKNLPAIRDIPYSRIEALAIARAHDRSPFIADEKKREEFKAEAEGISKPYDSGSAIGFAHTLLATGTRAFVGSLWPVDDAATLLLMVMFYEELRNSLLPPAEALYAAQKRMRNLTEEELHDIIDEVEEHVNHGDADEFVINPMYHIGQLKQQDVKELAEERYWAAFVLTGYGSKELYHQD
ncbi:hypothetical protein N0V90_005842 [Kalmusia sp. IMI 367209]|nr:hypothetical protein N0V90_005842 [Kalmusia sp. IMI 367209]